MARPKPVESPPPPKAGEWPPPAWQVQTLIESGEEHLLDERLVRSTAASSTTPIHINNTNNSSGPSAGPRPPAGTDEISLTQAVAEYCDGTTNTNNADTRSETNEEGPRPSAGTNEISLTQSVADYCDDVESQSGHKSMQN